MAGFLEQPVASDNSTLPRTAVRPEHKSGEVLVVGHYPSVNDFDTVAPLNSTSGRSADRDRSRTPPAPIDQGYGPQIDLVSGPTYSSLAFGARFSRRPAGTGLTHGNHSARRGQSPIPPSRSASQALTHDPPLPLFLRTPKGQLLCIFGLFSRIAAPFGVASQCCRMCSSRWLVAACALDMLLGYRETHRWMTLTSGALSGLIVAFILGPQEPWLVVACVAGFASISKRVLANRREHGPTNVAESTGRPGTVVLTLVFDSAVGTCSQLSSTSSIWPSGVSR
jgi:hypothetical protein